MFWTISCVTSVMGSSVVENTLHFFAATSIAYSTTASTAGQLSTPCRPSSVTDPWSRKVEIVHVPQAHVKTGFSSNSKQKVPVSLITYNSVATGNYSSLLIFVSNFL